VLADLEKILKDNQIAAWNGFDKANRNILDGSYFTLEAQFSRASITAHGYMRWPPNFDAGAQALWDYLDDLARHPR